MDGQKDEKTSERDEETSSTLAHSASTEAVDRMTAVTAEMKRNELRASSSSIQELMEIGHALGLTSKDLHEFIKDQQALGREKRRLSHEEKREKSQFAYERDRVTARI